MKLLAFALPTFCVLGSASASSTFDCGEPGSYDLNDLPYTGTMQQISDGCSRDTSCISTIPCWDVSEVENFEGAFMNMNQYDPFPDITHWDVSKATKINGMFAGLRTFNLPIGHWNVAKVKDMNNVFASTVVFNQPLNSWDTGEVTNMRHMFFRAYQFNQPLHSWNTAKVQDFKEMFKESNFNQPIYTWDTTNVGRLWSGTLATNMFAHSPFNQCVTNFMHLWTRPAEDNARQEPSYMGINLVRDMFTGTHCPNGDSPHTLDSTVQSWCNDECNPIITPLEPWEIRSNVQSPATVEPPLNTDGPTVMVGEPDGSSIAGTVLFELNLPEGTEAQARAFAVADDGSCTGDLIVPAIVTTLTGSCSFYLVHPLDSDGATEDQFYTRVSGREDLAYGTGQQVCLPGFEGFGDIREVSFSVSDVENSQIYNANGDAPKTQFCIQLSVVETSSQTVINSVNHKISFTHTVSGNFGSFEVDVNLDGDTSVSVVETDKQLNRGYDITADLCSVETRYKLGQPFTVCVYSPDDSMQIEGLSNVVCKGRTLIGADGNTDFLTTMERRDTHDFQFSSIVVDTYFTDPQTYDNGDQYFSCSGDVELATYATGADRRKLKKTFSLVRERRLKADNEEHKFATKISIGAEGGSADATTSPGVLPGWSAVATAAGAVATVGALF